MSEESSLQLQRVLEGALLAAGKPLSVQNLAELFEDHERPDNEAIRSALTAIGEQHLGRGFELKEVASGFRFQVIQEVAPWVARMWEEKPQKYSRALLETLALIAYRQPITRGDIEEIRGVAVSSNIIKTLLEREWIRVVGHKDVPGRPAMYATTRKFLDYFDLKNLDDLPTLAELRDLDSLNAELALEGADTQLPPDDSDAENDASVEAADNASQTAEADDAGSGAGEPSEPSAAVVLADAEETLGNGESVADEIVQAQAEDSDANVESSAETAPEIETGAESDTGSDVSSKIPEEVDTPFGSSHS